MHPARGFVTHVRHRLEIGAQVEKPAPHKYAYFAVAAAAFLKSPALK